MTGVCKTHFTVNAKKITMNYIFIMLPVVLLILTGIRFVRPMHRGLIERFGKYQKLVNPGFRWILPVVDRMYVVNINEQMVDVELSETLHKETKTVTVNKMP